MRGRGESRKKEIKSSENQDEATKTRSRKMTKVSLSDAPAESWRNPINGTSHCVMGRQASVEVQTPTQVTLISNIILARGRLALLIG